MITKIIFESHLACKYKAYLLKNPGEGDKPGANDYAAFMRGLDNEYFESARRTLFQSYGLNLTMSPEDTNASMLTGSELIINGTLRCQGFDVVIDAMERVSGKSTLGIHHYRPILLSRKPVEASLKLVLGFMGYVLSKAQGRIPDFGIIVSGGDYRKQRVKLPMFVERARIEVENLNRQVKPTLILNPNCKECEYQRFCREQARKKDDLSLLGTSQKEISGLHAKGIFTINQLAHSYRPRRRPIESKAKFYIALKAMAIGDARTYIVDKPLVPCEKTDIFIDVEALPEKDFYYLIGITVRRGRNLRSYSFWADDRAGERGIWIELLKLLGGLDQYTIFHYGDYERLFFDKMRKRYRLDEKESRTFTYARSRLSNAVSHIYGRVYFPTYTNSLKEVGSFLGASWSGKLDGLLSICWRISWERSRQDHFKEELLKYNTDDCAALVKVIDFLREISKSKKETGLLDGKEVASANDLRFKSTYRWGSNSFLVSEFDRINKCAYFDYQSTKIFLGKRRKPTRKVPSKRSTERMRFRVNRTVVYEPPLLCPKCKSDFTYKHSGYAKVIVDLKFSEGGVKRWAVKHVGQRRICKDCRTLYLSKKYPLHGTTFGPNISRFVVYLNIALRMSFGEIREYFRCMFRFDLNTTVLSRMKQIEAARYAKLAKGLLRQIKDGKLVQVDETHARLDGKSCYVWVFSTLSEVVFLYADSRKGDILHKHLGRFRGVLVSDFFSAYDAMPCKQQKCLIHLIRDLNDDLFKNQLNEEFKGLVQDFAFLMTEIVGTIDRWGLRARYLAKHKMIVRKFFRQLKKNEYETEICKQYQKRFQKNEDRLFTFLDYDNVPWNNNYAETRPSGSELRVKIEKA